MDPFEDPRPESPPSRSGEDPVESQRRSGEALAESPSRPGEVSVEPAGALAEGLDGELASDEEQAVDLSCNVCGAPVRWSPGDEALRCEHCGSVTEVEVEEADIEERPLAAAADAARGLGVEVRVLACDVCQARVTFDGATVSRACPFCGSPGVLDREASRNALRPESLIPLRVERGRVQENFREWTRGLWFRPNALKKVTADVAVGVYVPAWGFDAHVASRWTAQSGTYYWVTQTYTVRVNGRTQVRTRQVRKVRWWPSSGRRADFHDDVLVFASKGIDRELAERLGPYSTGGLVPYTPEFLAGWRAEEYQVDLVDGWDLGRDTIRARQRDRCAGDVPGDTHRNLRVRNEFSDVRWKLMLLPMWSVAYRLGGRSYAVLVHGETGRVVGHAPYSWVKILLAVLGVVAALALLALVAQAAR